MDLIWKVSARAKEILVQKEEGKKPDDGANAGENAPSQSANETVISSSSNIGEQEFVEPSAEPTDDRSDKSSTPEYDVKEEKEKKESESPIESAEQERPAPTGSTAGGKAPDIREVSFKAVEQARSFGSYLYGFAKSTKSSISETAKHLKSTVEQNSILGDFNKEQEAFVNNKTPKTSDAGLPPWVGCEDEENVKQQILSLSSDKRNFLRSPPAGVLFEFNFDAMHPIATVMLKEDTSLEKMRFELVPKSVSEENFWRNYFYRVSLLKQSTRLSSMSHQKSGSGDSSSWTAKKNTSDENAKESKHPTCKDDHEGTGMRKSDQEFVSDDLQTSHISEADIKQGMQLLGVSDKAKKEDDWEKELQKELEQEYEVVTEGNSDEYLLDSDMLENEIDQILGKEKVKDIV